MFKNILIKTLYEKRWSILGWCIAIIFMTMLTTMLFPTFKETFGASLQEVPESMRAFFGDSDAFTTLSGFVDVQVVSQLVFLTIIMAVILGSGLIAGDEQDKALHSLLAQPVRRSTVFWQKYFALMLTTLLSTITIFIGVFISALIIDESMNWWRMAQASFGIFLITFVFAALSYGLGSYTGKRGLSGSLVGFFAFVSYIITSLAVSVDALKIPDKLSPFHYFNAPDASIIKLGLDFGNVTVLLLIIIIATLLGFLRFINRDIRN